MEQRPLVIGLTGPIGSGKSTVMADLISLGAEGIDADRVAHEVMAPGGPAHAPILAELGNDFLTTAGMIDRSRLGQQVFADPQKLARLEAIVHPAVGSEIARRVAVSRAPAVVIEAIKLLEAGLSRQLCDQVWVTRCRVRQQIARLRASRGMSETEVRRRLASQMPLRRMIAQAQRVIDTGGSRAETGVRALRAWQDLGLPLPTPVIRAGTLDDADGIATVLNAVVREGGLTIIRDTWTAAQERTFLRRLSPRSHQTLAQIGNVVVGCQLIERYDPYPGAMDHVATMGSYVLAGLRGQGLGAAMGRASLAAARAFGYRKIVINVRADNPGAQAFYTSLGFRSCGRLSEQAFVDGRYVDELLYELFIEERSA